MATNEQKTKQYELNRKLFEECIAKEIDYTRIMQLLSEGAEPLGKIGLDDSNVYDEFIEELLYDSKPQALYDVTKLFLEAGMNLSCPPEPYDDNSLHPLWSMAFHSQYNLINTIKLLLDSGIDADSAGQCWGHIFTDVWLCGGCGIPLDKGGIDFYAEDLHKIFLIASYPHILSVDIELQKFIWVNENDYDPCRFRDWNKYSFKADMESCIAEDNIYKALISIIDENGNEVWKFRFGE